MTEDCRIATARRKHCRSVALGPLYQRQSLGYVECSTIFIMGCRVSETPSDIYNSNANCVRAY
jgi:hypothetical protein